MTLGLAPKVDAALVMANDVRLRAAAAAVQKRHGGIVVHDERKKITQGSTTIDESVMILSFERSSQVVYLSSNPSSLSLKVVVGQCFPFLFHLVPNLDGSRIRDKSS